MAKRLTFGGRPVAAAPIAGSATFFAIDVPLPSILTRGGYNNIGWSVKCQNFSFAGQFGFQVSTCNAQYAGFYTNNASFFNGASWSLFAFGADPCTEVANLSAIVYTAPCVADLDGNGTVDGGDLGALLAAWGGTGAGDLDTNGIIDGGDLGVMLASWGACP